MAVAGMIAKGELLLAMLAFVIGSTLVLLDMLWRNLRISNKIVLLIPIACLLLGIPSVLWLNYRLKISPIAKTLTLYEKNAWGHQVWKGKTNIPINLLTTFHLEAEPIAPENKHSYILQPAFRHDVDNAQARLRLILHIPISCQFSQLSSTQGQGKWSSPQTI